MSIVGEAGLTAEDRRCLTFADGFEQDYLNQGDERRTYTETLDLGWKLLAPFPAAELKRVTPTQVADHHHAETET